MIFGKIKQGDGYILIKQQHVPVRALSCYKNHNLKENGTLASTQNIIEFSGPQIYQKEMVTI